MLLKLSLLIFLSQVSNIFARGGFLPDSFTAKFEQSYKSALRGRMIKSTGRIDYLYPGSIKVLTEKPQKLIYTSNNQTTWYYTPAFIEGEPGQVTILEKGKNPLTRLFDTLRRGLKTNSLYSVKTSGNMASISFTEKSRKKLGLIKAIFYFKSSPHLFSSVEKVTFTSIDNKMKTLRLEQLQVDRKFKKNFFTFAIPENTKINR